MADHPGILVKDGPTGRRAALAYGPDVWEVIKVVREIAGRQTLSRSPGALPTRCG
jgi:hypothetical protein